MSRDHTKVERVLADRSTRRGTAERKRRVRKPRLKLHVHSNLSMPEKLLGWELELLLPVVGDLLDDLLEEAGNDEQTSKESATKLK